MTKLVHTYIINTLNYYISLYHKLPMYQLKKIQLIFNRDARLIVGIFLKEKIIPVLNDLQWLPVKTRIVFKSCVLDIQCIHFKKFYTYFSFYARERNLE